MQYSKQKPKIADSLEIIFTEIKTLQQNNLNLTNSISNLSKTVQILTSKLDQIPKVEKIDYGKISTDNLNLINKLLGIIRKDLTNSENKIIEKMATIKTSLF